MSETTVYSYWKCSSCNKINRGDVRICSCGSRIPNGVKYLMPDNPIVQKAIANGTINVENGHIDEKGIVSDIAKVQSKGKPNWDCAYCGYQNKYEDINCIGCGAGRGQKDYFSKRTEGWNCSFCNTTVDYSDDICPNCGTSRFYEEITSYNPPAPTTSSTNNAASSTSVNVPKKESTFKKTVKNFFANNTKAIVLGLAAIAVIVGLVWLFTPITRTATVTGYSWQRSIDVEQYTECYENDWYLPSDARLHHSAKEIHHYESVLDHYETKTRTYTERVFDGYDTQYRDNGNGTAQMVQVPRYRTETRTETYKEPVYRQEPVYKTKYYYYIDRWKVVSSLDTEGTNRNPYWKETTIPVTNSYPKLGEYKQGTRTEKYYIVIIDETETTQYVPVEYSRWIEWNKEVITYKTFRFSHSPLGAVIEE